MSTLFHGTPIALTNPETGYAPAWVAKKINDFQPTNEVPRLKSYITSAISTMTKPIDSASSFWNMVEKLSRILILTLVPWTTWITAKTFDHSKSIAMEVQWRAAHEDMAKEKIAQIDRIDRELQEWRIKFNIFADESRNAMRTTDSSVRDIAARIGVMSETLIRLQEGQSAIKEKMVSLQVVTDDLNKKQ